MEPEIPNEKNAHQATVARFNVGKKVIKATTEETTLSTMTDIQVKLDQEKAARQSAEKRFLEVEKYKAELSVHIKQYEQQISNLQNEYRREKEKGRNLSLQVEQEIQRRNLMQSDFESQTDELARYKTIEKQLNKEISDLKEASRSSEEEIRNLREDLSVNELQMKKLQDQLEAEQYVYSLYRSQVKDPKDDEEEKNKYYKDTKTDLMALREEKDSLAQQLQLALAKAESEHIALMIAEEQLADVEKEKTGLRLEIKELVSRHKNELLKKDTIIASVEESNRDYFKQVEQLQKDKDDINERMKSLHNDDKNIQQKTIRDNEIEKLKENVEKERMIKIQALNKLAEMMNRQEFRNQTLKKKQADLGILQKELLMEKEQINKMVEKYARDLSETQAALYDEGQQKARLWMALDSKDSEIVQLRQKLAFVNIDTASLNSSTQEDSENSDVILEGWLAVPNRSNIKKYGWKKQYVVVSSRKVLFYNTENEKQNSDPVLVLDIEKLFHVRQVTHGDVYRAEAKDTPRIFQVLYASEGENRRQAETHNEVSPQDKSAVMNYKGHELIALHYRTPTSCDACNKPVWHLVHPPQALECRHCHTKVHKEHYDKNEEFIGYCKVNYDQNIQAKEMLLLAETADKQKQWIQHLSKKITKKGIVVQEI